ncbi:penicillin-binding protein 1A [Salirhabdus sp. Marseille-P4669]|uniref:penicillin-binding protein 1A n=1 Tax=Salirhabdus sp. Marseille-P4669 TaxID=2042310 RepID=UPI000C7DFA33|nr:penicillin-binding protein 1A [Salirhabdus sp. Marseille-P4669]
MAENSQSRMQRRNAKKEKKSKGKNKKLNWKKVLLIFGIVMAVFIIGIVGTFAYYVSGAPDLNPEELSDPLSSKIYDRNGDLIVELGAQKRTKISYDDIPSILEDAVIATEDSRFYDHFGVDVFRMASAVWANVTDGFGSQGASTITQQVVKNAFLSTDKTMKRKIQEQWLAIKLEREYSKQEILTMYLNKIHYGDSTYGVAKAAEVYFGKKDLHDLTLPEAALLAGIPQRPNAYNPFKNPDLAEERRNLVLDLMVQHNKITEEEAAEAKKVTIEEMVVDGYENSMEYSDFLEKVVQEVQAKLGDEVDIYQDGLEIYTTLDVNAQERVELLLSSSDENPLKANYVDENVQAAITVMDTKTGEILAIGGGRDGKQGIGADFNYAFQDGFQPGSTMKPIVDYGPYIEYEKASTYTQIVDEKYSYSWGKEINNWDTNYTGQQTMRYHLKESRNIPALKIFQEVGSERAEQFVSGLGIPIPEDGVTETDAIGGHIEPTTVQMAGAYAAFGNKGIYNEPHTVRKVVIGNQTIDFKQEPEIAMSDYTAFMISDMLKDVLTNGTGTRANVPGIPVAGKTGTTNDDMDSWFAGYTTNYTIAVWTGYPKTSDTLPFDAKIIPQLMFKDVMTQLSSGVDTADFEQPNSVVQVAIEKGSNPAKLPSEFTPEDEIVYEWFVKGTEPKETSEKYDKIDPVKDLKAEYNEKDNTVKLKWKYDNKEKVVFDVRAGVQNSDMSTVSDIKDKEVIITHIQPGQTYLFEVIAVSEQDSANRSEAVSVTLEIPEKEEDLLDDLLDGDQGEGNENGNGNGNGNGNNGNGNGNNGNGNGNNDDDGGGEEGRPDDGGTDGEEEGEPDEPGDGEGEAPVDGDNPENPEEGAA